MSTQSSPVTPEVFITTTASGDNVDIIITSSFVCWSFIAICGVSELLGPLSVIWWMGLPPIHDSQHPRLDCFTVSSHRPDDRQFIYKCLTLEQCKGTSQNTSQQRYPLAYRPGPWFNIKMSSYQYRKSHCGDKTILWPSYLHNGISITGKTTPLYWIRAQPITNGWYQLIGDHVSHPSDMVTWLRLCNSLIPDPYCGQKIAVWLNRSGCHCNVHGLWLHSGMLRMLHGIWPVVCYAWSGHLKITALKQKFWNECMNEKNILAFKLCAKAEKKFQTPCAWFCLGCIVVVGRFTWFIYPYLSGLLHWEVDLWEMG